MTYVPAPAHGDCSTGKWQYATRKQAKAAKSLKGRRDGGLRPYRCPHCSWFHLGHQPKTVRRGTYDKSKWLATKGDL